MKENRKKRKIILRKTVRLVPKNTGEFFLGFRLNKGKTGQLWRLDTLENC